ARPATGTPPPGGRAAPAAGGNRGGGVPRGNSVCAPCPGPAESSLSVAGRLESTGPRFAPPDDPATPQQPDASAGAVRAPRPGLPHDVLVRADGLQLRAHRQRPWPRGV